MPPEFPSHASTPRVLWTNNRLPDAFRSKVEHTLAIPGLEISYDDLATKLGDLYYEPLAIFLDELAREIAWQDAMQDTWALVYQASRAIARAWNISKNRLHIDNSTKHTHTIHHIPNNRLGKMAGALVHERLAELLLRLAEKLKKDAKADANRIPPRPQLAGLLRAAADLLEQAGTQIEVRWLEKMQNRI